MANEAQQIRDRIKAAGVKPSHVSVRTSRGGSVNVRILDVSVPFDTVESIARDYEKVRRCHASGEILSGGNTFIFVGYDAAALEPFEKDIRDKAAALDPGVYLNDLYGFQVRRLPDRGFEVIETSDDAGPGRVWPMQWTADDVAHCIAGRAAKAGRLARAEAAPEPTPAPAAEVEAAPAYRAESAPPAADPRPRIASATDVFNATADIRSQNREHFVAFHLDVRCRVIARYTVSIGHLCGVEVHPREVFRAAIKDGAHALIFVHNHPSGDPSPSHQDIALTARLVEVGKICGIEVLDHVVVSEGGFVSLRDKGHVS